MFYCSIKPWYISRQREDILVGCIIYLKVFKNALEFSITNYHILLNNIINIIEDKIQKEKYENIDKVVNSVIECCQNLVFMAAKP